MAHSAGSDGPLCGKSKHSFDEGSEPGKTMWLSLDKSVSCDQGELEFSSSEEDANQ